MLTNEEIVAAFEAAGIDLAFRSFEQDIECARAVEQAAYAAAIKACNNERVDAESTGAKEDYAYNAAIRHCADAIRSLMEQPK